MPEPTRYFGTAAQRGLERRADLLWQVVKDDPGYCFHGRAVGLLKNPDAGAEAQIALARLQGLGPAPRLGPEVAAARVAEIARAGLLVEVQQRWVAGEAGVEIARAVLRDSVLPAGVEVREVGPDTTSEDFDRLDALTQACGILLPASGFLRGDAGPAACLYAKAPDGEVAGFAAALAQAGCAPSEQGMVWWGFLSTAEGWRGRGIARMLGAQAMVEMADRHGFRWFETGIVGENAASIAVTRQLGFKDSGRLDVLAICPDTLSDGKLPS